ncbi:MAG: Carnitine O-acetyltransferase mitochondrial [Chaenotheca gracillima]|nr:MAG: Carnitine O-acetyltransferase mitochondrial [Chaenotheca gracillima]
MAAALLAVIIYLAVHAGCCKTPRPGSGGGSAPSPGPTSYPTSDPPHRYLFAFGASYTATGFDLDGMWPNVDNPIGNPAFPGVTLSKGPTWVDWLTTYYNSSLTYTFNLAVAGAVTDKNITGPDSTVRSFTEQVNELYLPTLAKRPTHAQWDPSTAAFGVFVGINDIQVYYKNTTTDINSQAELLLNSYFDNLEALHQSGARNFFTFNINPQQISPSFSSDKKTDIQRFAKWVDVYNRKMVEHGDTFRSKHKDSKILVFDNHAVWDRVLKDPKDYCFQDTTCIGNGTCPCLWANDFHPGYTMQKVVTKQLAADLKNQSIF